VCLGVEGNGRYRISIYHDSSAMMSNHGDWSFVLVFYVVYSAFPFGGSYSHGPVQPIAE